MRLLSPRPPRVEKLKRAGDVGGLIRALTFTDRAAARAGRVTDLGVPVRAAAAEALAELGDARATDALVAALDDPHEPVRLAAVGALRALALPAAVAALTASVTSWTDPEYGVGRARALEALVEIADPGAARMAAAALLARPGELGESDRDALTALAQAAGARAAIADLVAELGSPAGSRACVLLGWLAPASVQPLIDALGDPRARREAAVALGAACDARAVDPLVAVLGSSPDPATRAAAAAALGEIRHPGAIEALLRASSDDVYAVRAEASASFDRLGGVAIAVATSALVATSRDQGAGVLELPANGAEPSAAEPSLATRAVPVLRRLLGR